MRIGVIGGGAWGTALASVAARDGEPVLLWAREPEVVEAINASHENPLFLAGVPLPRSIQATGTIGDLSGCEALLVVSPAQFVRATLSELPAEGVNFEQLQRLLADGRVDNAVAVNVSVIAHPF